MILLSRTKNARFHASLEDPGVFLLPTVSGKVGIPIQRSQDILELTV